jgi:predicted aldo/keto reductase-like oxidoreductase
MIYKPFKDESLSRLGMGNMRLPTTGEHGPIDREKAQEIVDYAISHGINYFDTAYIYHGGESESFTGDALAKYPRSSYNLATKFNVMSGTDYKMYFEKQLEKLKTDYIDFYLIHGIFDNNIDQYINIGAVDYFAEQKKAGRIRNFGFSSHASVQALERFVKLRDWDFAQIQMNYLDWTLQNSKAQYELLTKYNIPVIVMEPVRGGRLASLSPEADAVLKEAQPNWSIASWAFRWLLRLPNVQVILSGMTTIDQIKDNVATFEKYEPLTDEQADVLMRACDMFRGQVNVPCTACRYCCDDCPQGLDIPKLMELYNHYKLSGPGGLWMMGSLDKKPSECIACGACATHCPQGIAIPDVIAELAGAAAHRPGPSPSKKD